jgi:hypothetical protein
MLEFQLELLLKEWKDGLIDSEFVSSSSLLTLKKRLKSLIDRNIHIDDEELNDFAHDVDMFSGG